MQRTREDPLVLPGLYPDRNVAHVLVRLLVEGEADASKLELRDLVPVWKVGVKCQRVLLLLEEVNVQAFPPV